MVQINADKSFLTYQSHFANDRMAGSVPKWNHEGDASSASPSTQSALGFSEEASQGGSTPAPRLSFDELIDVVNPLQHLPVVGTLYRHLTGDDLSASARITGGAIYGGVMGAATSLVVAAMEEHGGGSVASSLIETSSSDRSVDLFAEEPRTAGLAPRVHGHGPTVTQEEAVEISQVMPHKHVQKPDRLVADKVFDQDIFDTMPEPEPVTKIQMADVVSQPSQRWKFNT